MTEILKGGDQLKRFWSIFEDNLDGYDVALAIIGGLFGVLFGVAIFWLFIYK